MPTHEQELAKVGAELIDIFERIATEVETKQPDAWQLPESRSVRDTITPLRRILRETTADTTLEDSEGRRWGITIRQVPLEEVIPGVSLFELDKRIETVSATGFDQGAPQVYEIGLTQEVLPHIPDSKGNPQVKSETVLVTRRRAITLSANVPPAQPESLAGAVTTAALVMESRGYTLVIQRERTSPPVYRVNAAGKVI